MPERTDSVCSSGSTEDFGIQLFPFIDGLSFSREEKQHDKKKEHAYLSLRQRRQMKLGIRKVLPVYVPLANEQVTAKNWRWYGALEKVYNQRDPWASFHIDDLPVHEATRHRYNPLKKKWYQDTVQVKMESTPFNRGAMRQCFRLKKLSKFCHSHDWHNADNYVAKHYIECVDRSVYFGDVKLQMDAKLWAEEYNRHNPPKKVDIFQEYIIELVNEEGSPLYHLEHFIEGEYIKYNSNSGFVEDASGLRFTPQAFSHFTFERSGHELIVVDIQGVGDLYTDPQIHTVDGVQYNDGNLGTKGMALFFHSHECNEICQALSLTPFDLSPSEQTAIKTHQASMIPSQTHARGAEEFVRSPSVDERRDLARMLSIPRQRTMSSVSDMDDCGNGDHEKCSRLDSHGDDNLHAMLIDSGIVSPSNSVYSPSQYGHDTSDYSSSLPSHPSTTKQEEERKYGIHTNLKRPSDILAEKTLRETSVYHLGDSILGQVHHELAKYHEIGRFAVDGLEFNIDWSSALFHEEIAAQLGVSDAIITMAKIYLQLPHDILVECSVPETIDNTNKGVEYMLQAAQNNDRAAMIYMAKAYESGFGLGTVRSRSYKEAVFWYHNAIQMQCADENGEFDATMADPNYLLLSKQAELYLVGGFDLERDCSRAGELYTEAADEAMAAMKGRLSNEFYMKAEEAWAAADE